MARLALLWTMALPVVRAADLPTAQEQAAMIEAMRSYAAQYQDAMPNFVCTRTVRHFESGLKRIHWRKEGEEEQDLSVVDGQEHRELRGARFRRGRLETEGEFVAYLTQIFNPSSEAEFEWSGWDTIRGQPVATFRFAIDREHSTKVVMNYGVSARIAYHGRVWGDPKTGTVFRVHHESDDIPTELQIESTQTSIDYAPVTIKGHESILPALAVTETKSPRRWIRNETEFRNYREFQADSKITFGPPTQP